MSRSGASEETQVYTARVLETFRGPALPDVSYVMVTEPGETPALPKEPVIVALCRDGESFYWPGVGSRFPNNAATRAAALEAGKQAPPAQETFRNCE